MPQKRRLRKNHFQSLVTNLPSFNDLHYLHNPFSFEFMECVNILSQSSDSDVVVTSDQAATHCGL